MGWLFWLSEDDKIIRKLLKEHPNPHVRVVGNGAVTLDSEKIRQSTQYKEFKDEIQAFREGR